MVYQKKKNSQAARLLKEDPYNMNEDGDRVKLFVLITTSHIKVIWHWWAPLEATNHKMQPECIWL